ncbi:MAG TPA: hypothetical protein VNV65_09275 [Candidatus Solibacter sp.]|jgi:hypothetical protein|nr:hypothetical protein [Candidatus Solibacter sp.]
MFTRSFAEIGEPFEAVEVALLQAPEIWLPDATTPKARLGLGSGEIKVHVGAAGLTKNVRIAFGPPQRNATKTSIPVSWRATGLSWLFPQLDGVLEVSRSDSMRTLLALLVEYRPPLGLLGEILDEALLHRIAWATVSIFRDTVAQTLEELAQRDCSPSRVEAEP